MNNEQIYRDTKDYYLEQNVGVSSHIISFIKKNAGNRILDVGCATGHYSIELSKHGFDCTAVDNNKKYIISIEERDINALIADGAALPFRDNSFETVILVEVLEHIPNVSKILAEVNRVATKNILITVPNCGQFEELRKSGLTYEHFLEKDHINFFTKKSLEQLLSKYSKKNYVEETEPIVHRLLPYWIKKPIGLLYKLKIIEPTIYQRIFAIIDLTEDTND